MIKALLSLRRAFLKKESSTLVIAFQKPHAFFLRKISKWKYPVCHLELKHCNFIFHFYFPVYKPEESSIICTAPSFILSQPCSKRHWFWGSEVMKTIVQLRRIYCVFKASKGKNPVCTCISVYIYLYIYNWSIIDLQCFRCTARWFGYTNTHISFLKLFSIIDYYKILTVVPCAIQ